MRPDRSWMLRRKDCTGHVREEFMDGVDDFIKVVKGDSSVVDVLGLIPCPCARCKNHNKEELFWVESHLYHHGFMEGYTNWTLHGEQRWGFSGSAFVAQDHDEENRNPYIDMVMDATGDKLNAKPQDIGEDPNPSTSKFDKLLKDADEPLWEGCDKHTNLSAVAQLLNLKSEFNMSESCYDRMIVIIKSMLPKSERLPKNFYWSRRMVSDKRICSESCGNAVIEKYGEDRSMYPVVDEDVWLDVARPSKKGRIDGIRHDLDITSAQDSTHGSLSSDAIGPTSAPPLIEVQITQVVNATLSSFVQTQLIPLLSKIPGFELVNIQSNGASSQQRQVSGEEDQANRDEDLNLD